MGSEAMRDDVDIRAPVLDSVPAEAPFWIAINGVRRIVLSCSPHQPQSLALGHLLCEGWILTPADAVSMRVEAGPGGAVGVDVMVNAALADAGAALRRHRTEHGCGLRHGLDCAPGTLLRQRAPAAVDPDAAAELFRPLFAAADAAAPEGGVHAAGLALNGVLQYTSTDVARHCAVDRVVGAAARDGAALEQLALVLTSRVSGAIALKAAHAGVAAVLSRSLATSLAREIAVAAGMPVHERAARRNVS